MVGLKEFKLLMYVKIITNSLYTLTPMVLSILDYQLDEIAIGLLLLLNY